MGLGPLRSLLTKPGRRNVNRTAASPGVPSPLTPPVREVHLPRVYRARYVPPSGFFNLLTAYSSPHCAALFHAADACGVLPSELSPLKKLCRLSAASALLSFPGRHPSSEEERRVARAAFRALVLLRVRCARSPVKVYQRPMLSWNFSPLGFSLFPPWRMLPTSSPHALGARSTEASRLPGLQGFPLREARLVSEETADPSGVSHLMKLAIDKKGFEDRDY